MENNQSKISETIFIKKQIVDRIKDRKYKRGDIIEMVYYYNDYCADLD
jgi:hypothetical protein